jgi:hypothetical protein
MAFIKRHSAAFAFAALAIAGAYGFLVVEERTTDQLYENSLEACERGNKLRQVVFLNVQDAIRQDPGAGFERQMAILLDTPGIDPEYGTIDCEALIEQS